VKHLRIIILVMLSILLPLRGALAATMLCPDGAGTGTAVVVAEHGGHDMQADHPVAHDHAGGEVPDADGSPGDHPATCHFCASACCMASIVGTVPSLGVPNLVSKVVFPAFTACSPAFQSDGQDRPPRTI
jgi:hypothetical protein